MKYDYKPKNAKIYLELTENESKIEIDGEMEDLGFLLAIGLEESPDFLNIIKLAVDFNNYNKIKNN
jgi:hypothetical protein